MGLTMSTEICGHRLTSSPPQWSLGEASTDIDEPLPLIHGADSYRQSGDVSIAVVYGRDNDDDERGDEVQNLHVYDYYKRPPQYESAYKRKLSESTDGSCDGRSPLSVNSADERDDEFNTDSTDDDCSPVNTVRTRFPVTHYSHAFHNDTTAPASSASAHNALTRSYPYHDDFRSPADAAPPIHLRHQSDQLNGGAIHYSHSEQTLQRPRYYSATRPPSSSSSVPTGNSSSVSLSSLASPSSVGEDEKHDVDSDDDDDSSPPLRSRSLLQMPRIHSLDVDMETLSLSTSRSPVSQTPSPDSPENCPRTLLSFMRAQRGVPLTL